MKYPFSNEQVRVIKGNHELAGKRYKDNIMLKNKINNDYILDTYKINYMDLDLHEDPPKDSMIVMEEIKDVHIGPKE